MFRESNVYTCPATSGAYTHEPADYLGLYKDKCVSAVAEIRGVVEAQPDGRARVLWTNDGTSDRELCTIALARARKVWPKWGTDPACALRVFVLGTAYPTNFIKDSKGGMQSSKRYFDVGGLGVRTAEELSARLDGKAWSELAGGPPFRI